ncbi:MAG: hypothetical protein H0U29_08190, partial [Acidimicrobiia bacterium]|nr:hypothetical protein [Acidimicrobiia bacterium]
TARADAPASSADESEPYAVQRTGRNWQGVNDTGSGPSDSTGAIGTTRYIELVNRKFAIYNRSSNTPLGEGTLQDLTQEPFNIFDPQIMWDPTTGRFYYVADDVVSDTDNRLAFGYSKTASPNSAADFCQYVIPFGSRFPDYPKLGDTSNLLVIWANSFQGGGGFLGSDLYGITKPPAGSTCIPPGDFTISLEFDVQDASGNTFLTPVPANQTDASATGYAVSAGRSSGSAVTVFTVTKDASNFISVGPPRPMAVPAYSTPASAPQNNTTQKVDTLDGRLTQAVSAVDPSRSNRVAIWTQHTVLGGAGAEVRWYEINPLPATPVPFQTGKQTDGALFNFNAAISPDRRRNGAAANFGSKHVLFFNTSSSTEFVDIRATAQGGTAGVGASTLLKDSSGFISDFTCNTTPSRPFCRWGDYSAATPDPASATSEQSTGAVWGTNAFTDGTTAGTSADWRTQNFEVQPSSK